MYFKHLLQRHIQTCIFVYASCFNKCTSIDKIYITSATVSLNKNLTYLAWISWFICTLLECAHASVKCESWAEDVNVLLLQAVYHNLKPASLRQQLENISVEPQRAEVFAQVWASAAPDVLEKIRLGIFAPKKVSSCSALDVCVNLSLTRKPSAVSFAIPEDEILLSCQNLVRFPKEAWIKNEKIK